MTRMWLLVLLLCAVATGAGAQTKPEGLPSEAPVRLGPLKLNPTIALTNLGVDSNVFNAADIEHPQSDMTMTVTPRSDLWMQLGHAWLTGIVVEDFVYYQQFASERSINSHYRGDLWLPFNRVTMTGGAGYLSTRDRPGYEIDARSRHTEEDYHGTVEVQVFGKSNVGVSAHRTTYAFEPDAVYLGYNLQYQLNRTTTGVDLSFRHALTPVTDLKVLVSREQDRFEFSQFRDSDSTRVAGRLAFHARLAGSASFGYRDFQPLQAGVPAYHGPTANVDMSLRSFGTTLIGLQVTRDIDYSYEVEQPYYVGTGAGLSITQGVSGPFDIVGRIGIQQLAYQGVFSAVTSRPDRTDFVHLFGGGFGYRVGRDMRIGLNVVRQRRTSDVLGHGYDGVRFGTSVTYGF